MAGWLLGCGGASASTDEAKPAPVGPAKRDVEVERSAEPAASRPPLEARCEALCSRYRACAAAGADRCAEHCMRDSQSEHEHQRGSYVWRLMTCFEGIDCEPLLAGGAERVCGEMARRQLTPSQALESFCVASASRAVECRFPADQSDCLDRFRPSDDASLEQATRCLARPCAEVPACFARALGFAPSAAE